MATSAIAPNNNSAISPTNVAIRRFFANRKPMNTR